MSELDAEAQSLTDSRLKLFVLHPLAIAFFATISAVSLVHATTANHYCFATLVIVIVILGCITWFKAFSRRSQSRRQ